MFTRANFLIIEHTHTMLSMSMVEDGRLIWFNFIHKIQIVLKFQTYVCWSLHLFLPEILSNFGKSIYCFHCAFFNLNFSFFFGIWMLKIRENILWLTLSFFILSKIIFVNIRTLIYNQYAVFFLWQYFFYNFLQFLFENK